MTTANLAEMADVLGVSLPTMREYIKRWPDLPVIERGGQGAAWQFDAPAVAAFVKAREDEEKEAREQRNASLAQMSLPDDLFAADPQTAGMSATDLGKYYRALREGDELAKSRRLTISIGEGRQHLEPAWAFLSQEMRAVPGIIGREFNLPHDLVRAWTRRVNEILRQTHPKFGIFLYGGPPPGLDDDDQAA